MRLCIPTLKSLETEEVDLVVCRGLGRRAFTRLSEAGIPFFITWQPDVVAILEAHWAGRLGGAAFMKGKHAENHGSVSVD